MAEARIELRAGLLAGSSIHLVTGSSGIELRLATPSEAAWRALAGVIDRARLHLSSRGIVLRAGRAVQIEATDGGRPSGQRGP